MKCILLWQPNVNNNRLVFVSFQAIFYVVHCYYQVRLEENI